MNPHSNKSRWVWADGSGGGRNVFVMFRRRFRLDAMPESAVLHLFADNLYRLRVNGHVVATGPARFSPGHPEYDTHDLRKLLVAGDNEILVEANAKGTSSFQAMPSRGGFIAWGSAGDADFTTPGAWECLESRAWDQWAEPFSFAQGPVEILDLRRLAEEVGAAWSAPVPVENPEHWGALTPRSIPLPSRAQLVPEKIVALGDLRGGTFRIGFRVPADNGKFSLRRHGRFLFFTHIFSPFAQEVPCGVFWGPVFCNGEKLVHENCPDLGNRQNTVLPLRAGWNFLAGAPDALAPCWPWMMELPDGLGLRVAALPPEISAFGWDIPQSAAFVFSMPSASVDHWKQSMPSSLADLPRGELTWICEPAAHAATSPAREMAWDQLKSPSAAPSEARFPITLNAPGSAAATAVFDFGCEFLGHVRVRVRAPEGTVLDIGYDERLRGDGCIGFFTNHPFVNNADRFVLRGGGEEIESFHERGGRFLQITARDAAGPVVLEQVEVLKFEPDLDWSGAFSCSSDLMNWTWDAAAATIRASTSDGWIDPWRERAMYLGDCLVEMDAARCLTRDRRLDRWALRLWARTQREDGQMLDAVPSDHETALCDYSLIWIFLLRDHWAATGDTALVGELFPHVLRVLASPVWQADQSGLWVAHPGCTVFVDWGAPDLAKSGTNACLNAFRFRALEYAAEMASTCGIDPADFRNQAAGLAKAFDKAFWDPQTGRYCAAVVDGRKSLASALHANTLVLAFGLASPSRHESIHAYLAPALLGNHLAGGDRLELYFLHYALEALVRIGDFALAEQIIASHFGLMRERGAWTLWETLNGGKRPTGSHCHGWACSPTAYFHHHVLGIQTGHPLPPSTVRFSPASESLENASGTVPHLLGNIRAKWLVENGTLFASIYLPHGLDLVFEPRGKLAGLEAKLAVNGHAAGLPLKFPGSTPHQSAAVFA